MTELIDASTITEHERRAGRARERDRARRRSCSSTASGCCPSSWDRWAALFEEAGYVALTPGWPDDPETVAEANAHPEVFARKTVGQVADHFEEIIRELDAQAGRHRPLLRRAARADPRRPRAGRRVGGDRSGAVPRRAAAADLGAEVGARRCSATRPTAAAPCRSPTSSSASASPTPSARTRRRSSTRPSPCPPPARRSSRPRRRTSTRGPRPRSTRKNPDRGPLLIISGEKDNTVPWAIANASYKRQKRNEGVTEIVEIPGRGHALTIDSGWREVAQTALTFVQRAGSAEAGDVSAAPPGRRLTPATSRRVRREPARGGSRRGSGARSPSRAWPTAP